MRILIADTYYPEFLKSLPFDENSTYEVELRKVLDTQFGTSDFYSRNLEAQGHEVIDVIANHDGLCAMRSLHAQLATFVPDVAFLQDLSIELRYRPPLIAAQLSCPWPGDDKVKRCDVIFTSFPHYVPRIEALGVKAVYLPLAFEPSVLSGPQPERDIDISFVGGVGRDSHWKQGTDVLEAVAAAFPTRFQWFGYGLDRLPETSALRACYKGEAWGRKMYDIYRRSKIVVNRHGEVAEGYSQNMRNFEATGCGAMLLTEEAKNFTKPCDDCGHSSGAEFFKCGEEAIAYSEPHHDSRIGPEDIILEIEMRLSTHGRREEIAAAGQRRTLREHTYANRMKTISEVLTGMLCPA